MLAPHIWPITKQKLKIQKMIYKIQQKINVFVRLSLSYHFIALVPGSQPAVWENHGSWHRRAASLASGPWRRGAGDREGLQQVRTVMDRWRNNRCTMGLIQTNSSAPCKLRVTHMRELRSTQQMDEDHSEAEIWSKPKTHTHRHMKLPTCIVGMSQHSDGATWYSRMTSHGPSLSWLGIAGLFGLCTSERDPSLHPCAFRSSSCLFNLLTRSVHHNWSHELKKLKSYLFTRITLGIICKKCIGMFLWSTFMSKTLYLSYNFTINTGIYNKWNT